MVVSESPYPRARCAFKDRLKSSRVMCSGSCFTTKVRFETLASNLATHPFQDQKDVTFGFRFSVGAVITPESDDSMDASAELAAPRC